MVHGMKKSDEARVPMKAANKGANAPAELPEGRASTKGNSQDQSTYRTQGRVSVSQAVERIRQAATRKPQEKLTALLLGFSEEVEHRFRAKLNTDFGHRERSSVA